MCLILLAMLVLTPSAFAQWELLNDESTLNFVSVKNSKVGEIHYFKKLSGVIEKNGAVSINIDLSSVETNIPIRNDRMKTILFEIADFADAKITGTVNVDDVSSLAVGGTYSDSIKLTLSLHGVSQDLNSDVQVTKLTQQSVLVTTLRPILINAEDFNLADGIEKLRSVAGLSTISTAVPVTYSLVFKK
ncbi:YceI family protein [Amphritea sp. 1_MG-2023]|uniref:YceI family protein n=1 Tax=Amphritea sp. 1_MG-2023 TaxID=3062670 RepID=UPI0026E3900F|nr:YceI family protein [Amphritea sp. 1_MG-2023]MDO6562081.1 YceI family protein [Amphritea sp. 1_MG-2023]